MRRLLQRWLRARRDRRTLRQQGCVLFCPGCGCTLNDPRHPARKVDVVKLDDLTTLRCRLCDCVSEWHMGIAPVPLLRSSVWFPQRAEGAGA